MKRKVVKHGPATFIISLPSKWVQKYNVSKGDELDVEEDSNKLIIQTDGDSKKSSISLDMNNCPNSVKRTIGAIYKIGYDTVEITSQSPVERQIIRDAVTNFIGFEIIDEKKNSITMKQITIPDESEFKNMFRRMYLSLLSITEDFYDACKNNDLDLISELPLRDLSINRFADYCRRYINKHGVTDHKGREPSLYYLTESLEDIGDIYRDLANYLADKDYQLTEVHLEFLDKCNKLLRSTYNLFYTYSKEDFDKFLADIKRTKKQFFTKEFENSIVSAHLFHLFQSIFSLNGSILVTVL